MQATIPRLLSASPCGESDCIPVAWLVVAWPVAAWLTAAWLAARWLAAAWLAAVPAVQGFWMMGSMLAWRFSDGATGGAGAGPLRASVWAQSSLLLFVPRAKPLLLSSLLLEHVQFLASLCPQLAACAHNCKLSGWPPGRAVVLFAPPCVDKVPLCVLLAWQWRFGLLLVLPASLLLLLLLLSVHGVRFLFTASRTSKQPGISMGLGVWLAAAGNGGHGNGPWPACPT